MLGSLVQAVVTVTVVFALAEIAKRWSTLAAAVAALPLMTMLLVAKLAYDGIEKGGGIAKANEFAGKFFILVWPGLLFFIALPVAQKLGLPFWWSFGLAVVITFAATWGAIVLMKSLGMKV
jgi:hypothetical protein